MIQDIFPHQFHNPYNPEATPRPEDIVLNISQGKVLLSTEAFAHNEILFSRVLDWAEATVEELVYAFAIDEVRYFLLNRVCDEGELPSGYSYVLERDLRNEGIGPEDNLFASITGKHLSDWYTDNRYCGRCGGKTVHSPRERAMVCDACHYTSYPRIMPAVIVGVRNGNRLLITRYRTGFAHNALIAGFTEIGETVEETVAREVMEEAGVRVKNIHYYKSQPWGSANDILLGFYCDVDGEDTITMDNSELKFAEWVEREDIVLQPGHFSLTNEMMERFKNHQDE